MGIQIDASLGLGGDDYFGSQRFVNLHEMGHALAGVARTWPAGAPGMGLRVPHLRAGFRPVRRPVLVAQRYGVRADPLQDTGPQPRRVPAWDWFADSLGVPANGYGHWLACSVPRDVMSNSGWRYRGVDGESHWTYVTAVSATAAEISGGFSVDLSQVQGGVEADAAYLNSEKCRALMRRPQRSLLPGGVPAEAQGGPGWPETFRRPPRIRR